MQNIAFTGKGKVYFEEQQQQQLEKGIRLLVGASAFLVFLMAVELMTSDYSLYVTKFYFFMLVVMTLLSSVVFWWLAGKAYSMRNGSLYHCYLRVCSVFFGLYYHLSSIILHTYKPSFCTVKYIY
ncbi:hypothetical protein AS132_14955 [Photobacterium sanguinicancri]|nr:hypothetical protein AS132_14955 [Photobacterium sanguinicancri]